MTIIMIIILIIIIMILITIMIMMIAICIITTMTNHNRPLEEVLGRCCEARRKQRNDSMNNHKTNNT